MKNCPYCAESIQDAAIVCRYCGQDLRVVQIKPVEQAQPVSVGKRLTALALGAFVVVSAVEVVLVISRSAVQSSAISFGDALNLGLYVGFPASAFVGGFSAGRIARPDGTWLGLLAGGLGAALMMMEFGVLTNPKGITSAEDVFIAVLMILAGMVGGRLASNLA